MANFGFVKQDERGIYMGTLATLDFDAQIGLRPVQRTHDGMPHYDIMAKNRSGRWIAVGALWERTSQKTGLVYLSGKIDVPELRNPLYIALFRQDDGSYVIAWDRTDTSAGGMGRRGARGDDGNAGVDDGFGGAPGYGGGVPFEPDPMQGDGQGSDGGHGPDDGLGESTAPGSRGRRGRGAQQPVDEDLTVPA